MNPTNIYDVTTLTTANFLLLNSEKAEVFVFKPEHVRNRLSSHLVTLDGIDFALSNLRDISDQGLCFKANIKVPRTGFLTLIMTL